MRANRVRAKYGQKTDNPRQSTPKPQNDYYKLHGITWEHTPRGTPSGPIRQTDVRGCCCCCSCRCSPNRGSQNREIIRNSTRIYIYFKTLLLDKQAHSHTHTNDYINYDSILLYYCIILIINIIIKKNHMHLHPSYT